jgi:hypothetical protein
MNAINVTMALDGVTALCKSIKPSMTRSPRYTTPPRLVIDGEEHAHYSTYFHLHPIATAK